MYHNNCIEGFFDRIAKLRLSVIYAIKKDISKSAEVIEIDGVLYEEDSDGNIVEIPKSVPDEPEAAEPNELTVTVRNNSYTFIEGQTYQDAAGSYVVLEILPDDKIKVLYEDGRFAGQERIYDALERAKIIHRTKIDAEKMEVERKEKEKAQTIKRRFADVNHFELTGFMAANGNLYAQVPSDQVDILEEEYKALRGKKPDPDMYEVTNVGSKWHRQYRVRLPGNKVTPDMLALMESMGLEPKKTKSGNYDIYDTHYVKKLLEMGFDFGKASPADVINIDNYIKKNYGDEASDAFIQGYSL
jgi:hypothetical protein